MKAYGQFCPLAQATQLLCERWTLLIVRELIAGCTRFSELQKGLPLISPTLLSTRLKQLLKVGIIIQTKEANSYKYTLTKAGTELRPIVELMGAWGHRWAQSDLNDEDLDAGLLMWDMRRSIDPSVFPARKIVVHFEYSNVPKGATQWWLISENNKIDLCLNDPGYEVDIVIKCSLAAMTEVWICKTPFDQVVAQGRIKVFGDPKLTSNLQSWIRSSLLSRLGTVKNLPPLNWSVN
ncbi:MAG: helix-turn-helix transcriptional regulator [Gammaproteobacteria bacterium]|nr:helix-turn-helix transcriptional regulator [Gammaproteobacteria bacterium]